MSTKPYTDFWAVWSAADAAGATRLHLAVGKPPMARVPSGELAPIDGFDAALSNDDVLRLLSTLVDPDAWPRLERNGDGDASATSPDGRRVTITVFRAQASQAWSAVARW